MARSVIPGAGQFMANSRKSTGNAQKNLAMSVGPGLQDGDYS